jgi:lysophospholipase L1-like esterase
MHRPTVTAKDIINGYRQIVQRAHAAGLRVYGCTLTPAIGTLPVGTLWWFDSKDEAVRTADKAQLRKGGIFDYVVDFDALARDPDNPSRYRADLTEDHLHPNRMGAQILGKGIPLYLFVDGVRSPRHADGRLPQRLFW